jgi:Putative auto-transporter adhesin, head GIN domain
LGDQGFTLIEADLAREDLRSRCATREAGTQLEVRTRRHVCRPSRLLPTVRCFFRVAKGRNAQGRALLAVVSVGAMLVLGGCAGGLTKEGSGTEASENRPVDSFSRLSLSGEADVVVSVGGAQRVTVRGDDNLLEEVRTEVDDGELEISQPGNVDLKPKAGLTVEITLPDLEAVNVSGAGDVRVEGLRGDLFRVDVSGAGEVEAAGQVGRVEADLSGAASLRMGNLVAREVKVDLSGAGDIRVHATESLDASVSGAGRVVYSGDPPNVKTDVSGAGAVEPE